jgi:hypothetical protein
MELRHVSDWTTLVGAKVEIRREGISIAHGGVDTVTVDGSMLWLQTGLDPRKLYDKAERDEAWVNDSRLGFHYQINFGEAESGAHDRHDLQDDCIHSTPGSPEKFQVHLLRTRVRGTGLPLRDC